MAKKWTARCCSGTVDQALATAFHAGSNSLAKSQQPGSGSLEPGLPAGGALAPLVKGSELDGGRPGARGGREEAVGVWVELDDAAALVCSALEIFEGAGGKDEGRGEDGEEQLHGGKTCLFPKRKAGIY